MEAVIAAASSLHSVVALVALAAAGYAGYELAVEPDWRRRLPATAARVWVLVLLAVVGVEDLAFGTNAVLMLGYQTGVPLRYLQLAFVASLAAAVLVWTRD